MNSPARVLIVLGLLLCIAAACASAADPARYRTNTIDPRVRHVPAEIQGGVFRDPGKHLRPLVAFLVAGQPDDFGRVKLIHDWIADNIAYDVDGYFSGAQGNASSEGTLKQRRGVCHQYATLMEEMCSLADIPCQSISGYGRGYGFSSGGATRSDQTNHAWSAVQIGGRWYLVDTTWDAGHVEGRSYEKHYRTTYLFMEPQNFIYTHLPENPKWQLLATPLSAGQFERLPHLRGTFFDFGLKLETRLARVTPAGKSVQFAIGRTGDAELMTRLFTAADVELPQRTLVQTIDRQCQVYAVFPRAGRYRVKLFCRPRGDEGTFKLAANLDFDATAGSDRTFPDDFASFGKMRGYLYSPLYLPLATDTPVRFKVRLEDVHDVSLAIGDNAWLPLTRSATDRNLYELTTTVPAGQHVRLNAKLSPEDKAHKIVIDFGGGEG